MVLHTPERCFSAMRWPRPKSYGPFVDRLVHDLEGTSLEVRTLDNENPNRRPAIAVLPLNEAWLPPDMTDKEHQDLMTTMKRRDPFLFQPRKLRFTGIRPLVSEQQEVFFELGLDRISQNLLQQQRNSILRGIHAATGKPLSQGQSRVFGMTALYANPDIGRSIIPATVTYLSALLPLEVVFDPTDFTFPKIGPQGE